MHPDPVRGPSRGVRFQLSLEPLLDQRPVPPRTDRKARVADGDAVAVAGDAEFADLADPARNLFAFRAALVEVVIARAEDHLRDAGQQREIFLYHHDLGAEINEGADVERIAGEDHEVEFGCRRQQPIELRQ